MEWRGAWRDGAVRRPGQAYSSTCGRSSSGLSGPAAPSGFFPPLSSTGSGSRNDETGRADRTLAISEPLTDTVEGDLGPLERVWGPVEHKMHQHAEEVAELWKQISEELSRLEGTSDALIDCEGRLSPCFPKRRVFPQIGIPNKNVTTEPWPRGSS